MISALRLGGLLNQAELARDASLTRPTAHSKSPKPEVFFYRTAEGAEVDFVIEHKRRLLPIEVKASTRVTRDDVRHLERFCEEHGARWGMVAYAGDDAFALSSRVVAAPIGALL